MSAVSTPSPPVATCAGTDTDAAARRLAWLTVGVPAVGAVAAVVFAASGRLAGVHVALFAGLFLVTALGIEAGFHRLFAHRAFVASAVLAWGLGVAGSMAAEGPVLFWVAVHRQHHRYTDQDGDPHSPRPRGRGVRGSLAGAWHGHVGWLFRVRREGWTSYVPDLLAARRVFAINRGYFGFIALGLVAPMAVAGLVEWSWSAALGGLLWGGFLRIWAVQNVTWAVNSIGHILGQRPFETRDNSRNVGALALVSLGGSWHNNHHANPGLAVNRMRWWQLDIAGAFIRLLDRAGLVHEVRYPARSDTDGRNLG